MVVDEGRRIGKMTKRRTRKPYFLSHTITKHTIEHTPLDLLCKIADAVLGLLSLETAVPLPAIHPSPPPTPLIAEEFRMFSFSDDPAPILEVLMLLSAAPAPPLLSLRREKKAALALAFIPVCEPD